jgi:hypothetical protein
MKNRLAVLMMALTMFLLLACGGGGGGGGEDGILPESAARVDRDGDGYYVAEGDCDDNDSGRGPAKPEICRDDIDQDCDGVDALCEEEDWDGDGYAPLDGDCDDANPAIHPRAQEICGDGIDQNCNGTDPQCRIPGDEATNFDEFARTYEESIETENIDQYMTLFSPAAVSSGQTPACFRLVQGWNFRQYDFAQVEYLINGEPEIGEENGRTLATVNRTVRYIRISAGSGAETPIENSGVVHFVRENGLWNVYGNQIGYQAPTLVNFTTSTGVDETTGQPIDVTSQFTGMDSEIQMFFTVDNVVNGSMFTVRVVKPDGTLYSETPYEYNLGDYPNCVQNRASWFQTIAIFSLGDIGIPGIGIPGGPDVGFGFESMGIWTVELSLDGFGTLGFGNFEYLHMVGF